MYPDIARRVKTRIQASTSDSGDKLTVFAVLERILREDGLLGYYRGFMATMLNTFSMREFRLLLCITRMTCADVGP